jgi:hypothetical protein
MGLMRLIGPISAAQGPIGPMSPISPIRTTPTTFSMAKMFFPWSALHGIGLTRRPMRAITFTPEKPRRCSSVVEQRIRNARVVGSNPTTGLSNSPQSRSDDPAAAQ